MAAVVNGLIELRNVCKSYGPLIAVDNLSLSVKEGECFAFLGPNGAGKSTTIKMLTTLLKPDSGFVSVAGFDPVKDSRSVRSKIGVVFQTSSLDDDLTAAENLDMHGALYHVPRKIRVERADQLLKLVDLDKRKHSLVKEYSGGMKRRLEIARALLHHPRVIFLDEPTLGLDTQTRKTLWDYLRKLNVEEGVTIFFSTHYMDEADAVAQRIAVIDHGKLIALGSGAELKTRTGTESLEKAYLVLTGTDTRDIGAP